MNLPLTRSLPRQLKKIVRDAEIMKEDDNSWPQPDKVGRQELEIVLDGEVLFCVFPALFFWAQTGHVRALRNAAKYVAPTEMYAGLKPHPHARQLRTTEC